MNEIKEGFFHNIYYSIAGNKYYKFFLRQKVGKAILYLLLLSFIIGLLGMIAPLVILNSSISEMTLTYESDVPEFTFKNGELAVEGKMPLTIDGGYTTIIIDTKENNDESILNDYDNAVLVTKDKLIQKTYEKKQIINYSMLAGFSTNKAEVREMLPMLKWLTALFAVIMLIWFIIEKFLGALIYAVLGVALCKVMKLELTFKHNLILAIHAMTLPLILFGILDILPITLSLIHI